MSNSKWKELPDWNEDEPYSFLVAADNQEVAWEFLRRNEEYRTDWHQRESLHTEYVYYPPKQQGDTDEQWMRRTAYETDFDPIKKRKDVATAHKWGMESFYDPELPFSCGVRFIMPGGDFPRLITEPQDLDIFFEAIELEGVDFQQVVAEYAVVVVEMTRPLTTQLKAMKKVLRQKQQTLVNAGVIIEAERTAGQARTWIRHLRVLDARRMEPPATYREIAQTLGGLQSEGKTDDELRKQGEKFVAAARNMMRKGYKGILTYKGTPYQ